MARCPLIKKECPEHSKGKTGCAWWIDVPTEDGFESMCVTVAQFRVQATQVTQTEGVHAAVVTQGESYRQTSKAMIYSVLDMHQLNQSVLGHDEQEKLNAPECTS